MLVTNVFAFPLWIAYQKVFYEMEKKESYADNSETACVIEQSFIVGTLSFVCYLIVVLLESWVWYMVFIWMYVSSWGWCGNWRKIMNCFIESLWKPLFIPAKPQHINRAMLAKFLWQAKYMKKNIKKYIKFLNTKKKHNFFVQSEYFMRWKFTNGKTEKFVHIFLVVTTFAQYFSKFVLFVYGHII